MPAGDLLVANYDFEYKSTLICNGGTYVLVSGRVLDSPEIRTSDRVRGQLDGLFPGTDYYGKRTIELEIEVWCETEAEFKTSVAALKAALVLQRSESPLAFKLPGWSNNFIVNCKPRRVAGPTVNLQYDFFVGTVIVQLEATDPRLYGATLQTATVNLASAGSGLTFNVTPNISFGGISTSNIIEATNSGNYEAPWVAKITGPITNPSIENINAGKILQLNGSLALGEVLYIYSPPASSVLLGNTATRYSWIANTEQWFMLLPGQNQVRLGGSSAGTPTLQLDWRSAWVF